MYVSSDLKQSWLWLRPVIVQAGAPDNFTLETICPVGGDTS